MELNLVQSVTEFVISAPEDEEPGQKEICSNFDDIIISCVQGVCKNVTDVYREVKRVGLRGGENYIQCSFTIK